jgi:hypothetical protein
LYIKIKLEKLQYQKEPRPAWIGDEVVKNEMRATTVMIVTIMLAAVMFAAVGIPLESKVVDAQTAAQGSVTVVINEFMADNNAAVPSPYGNYPDWIELYNYGDYTVDLSGMYLTDDLENPAWQFKDGTKIGPKNYLLIWADGQPGRGALHTRFKVAASGGTLGLFAIDGVTLIDSIAYDKQLGDISFGRIPDGGASWRYLETPTPDEANKENERNTSSTPWPIWLLIIIALVVCIVFILKDKIRARRKQ